jgi:hypothetical protein
VVDEPEQDLNRDKNVDEAEIEEEPLCYDD